MTLTDKNLYSYCDNNPVTRVDTLGDYWNIAAGAVIGGAISAVFEAANQLAEMKTTGGTFDIKAVVCAGVSGAIVGGFKASGGNAIIQGVANALSTIITESYAQYKSGSNFGKAVSVIASKTLVSAIGGYRDGPGLRAKGSALSNVLEQNGIIKSRIKNNQYSLHNGAKRLRQNISHINKVKKKVTSSTTKNAVKSQAKSTVWGWVKKGINWLVENW